MKVLVIEDGVSKIQSARQILRTHEVEVAMSVNTAKLLMRKNIYDLIIIDMNLPTFEMDSGEAGRIQHDGGIRLIQYAKVHQKDAKCILFTQYDSLKVDGDIVSLGDITNHLLEKYPTNFLGSVLYKTETDKWINEFEDILEGMK